MGRLCAGMAAAVVAAFVGAGCTPSHTFFRPEAQTVVPRGGDLGCRYEVPPGSAGEGARVMISTDGARVVRTRSRQKVVVVRIRMTVDNFLDEPLGLEPRSTMLVDCNEIIFPVKYVTARGLGEDGTVPANGKAGVDIYFELGPPAIIARLGGFEVRWKYEVGSKAHSMESKFTRFEPVRARHYYESWYDPWPAGWVWWWGVGGIGRSRHYHRSGSSLTWGP